MIKSRKQEIEKELWSKFHELNSLYLGNSVYIQNIRIGKFFRDVVTPDSLTFGVFKMDTDTVFRNYKYVKVPSFAEIILNQYLFLPSLLGTLPRLSEFVLYHEMCHAMVMLEEPDNIAVNCFSTGLAHGPNWQKWWKLHSDYRAGEEILKDKTIHYTIRKEMMNDGSIERLVKKHKETPLVRKW